VTSSQGSTGSKKRRSSEKVEDLLEGKRKSSSSSLAKEHDKDFLEEEINLEGSPRATSTLAYEDSSHLMPLNYFL